MSKYTFDEAKRDYMKSASDAGAVICLPNEERSLPVAGGWLLRKADGQDITLVLFDRATAMLSFHKC